MHTATSSLDAQFDCLFIVLVDVVNARWVTRRRGEAGHATYATCFVATRGRRGVMSVTTTGRTDTAQRTSMSDQTRRPTLVRAGRSSAAAMVGPTTANSTRAPTCRWQLGRDTLTNSGISETTSSNSQSNSTSKSTDPTGLATQLALNTLLLKSSQ